ncbi:hypothetical protein BTN33_21730 [Aeromonas veronii]|uniref:hypothetical protein n=1 Tax=Aeromonas veronii TaxID=654 RepID=UPI000946E2C4|nr:hypothetical protein [Aeromonas veronii]OLF56985.1 hypothetical protein BTN33_21730 [Aeromonas veronii]
MTHNMTPTKRASDTEQRAVIANTTMHIRVISQGENPAIQPHPLKVICQADAQPFTLEAPWLGHCLLSGRPGSGNASPAGPPPHTTHDTGAAQ